jgi:choice-of-anchor C domain-containing protein
MKKRSSLGVALGVIAAMALAGVTFAFSGLTNGSFEDGTYTDNGGFEELSAVDSTTIAGWTVSAGSVDWIGSYWQAQEGSMSLDLNGTSAGTVTQTFDTTVGNTYDVSFYLAGNPDGLPAVKTLEVSATGGTPSSYSFDTTGFSRDSMGWTVQEYSFVATSTSTTLSFTSTVEGAFGPALDNVAVTETAPPTPPTPTADDCKDGGWQTITDGSGNHFKNQGDCVSYFATGGRNLGALSSTTASDVSDRADRKPAKSSVTHSTKAHDQATSRHESERSHGKAKTNVHGGDRHGPPSRG